MAEMTQDTIPESGHDVNRKYRRFSAGQRFEHIVLLVTFSGLALTGLPQSFAQYSWAQSLIALMGGIESVRILHRILATILMVESIYHGGIVTYKIFVLGYRATMIPGIRDIRDALQWIAYNLGFRKEHPKMPRYNFGEKAEYLAVVWGTVLMVATGFLLWNPIAATSFLPGEVIPAARAAHSAEAFLAVAAIIIWHMYNVHIRRFNRSMFTGNLTYEEMEEEHGEELEKIESGEIEYINPPEKIERRRRLFIPYALVVTAILASGLIWFITFEQTAITTVPGIPQGTVNVDFDPSRGLTEAGEILWTEQQCVDCHGIFANGANDPLGVNISGRSLTFAEFITAVRRGPAEMPAYTTVDLEDEEIADLWAYFQTVNTSENASSASGG